MREGRAQVSASVVAYGQERRRSQRVLIRVPVTLHISLQGQQTLKVCTANVSAHGAMLICPQNFPVNFRMVLEHPGTGQRQACRVARCSQESAGAGYQVGVEFENPAPGFWQIAFPPPDWKASAD